MFRHVIFILFFLNGMSVFGQDSASVANDITVLYRKESSGGVTIHSNGLGVLFRHGVQKTVKKKRMFEAEFVSMRHPKQYKITNDAYPGDSKPFFYGKLNYVYIPRIGIGRQHVIFGKGDVSGVEVRLNYFTGVDLAFTKPYYVKVIEADPYNENFAVVVEKKYDPSDPNQQDPTSFLGPGSYFSGFGLMKFYPGLYGKLSFSFEHSTEHQKLAVLEAGMVFDIFYKPIPIMAYNQNEQYFFNFYISLLWGGKYN
jgi:hypothetical protein